MELYVAVAVVLLTAFGFFLYQRKRALSFFSDLRICGPPPSLIHGNMNELQVGTDRPVLIMGEWQKKYGKVYGYYKGTNPILVVSDLELIKQITIRDFSNFVDRYQSEVTMKEVENSLIGMPAKRWKEVRKMLTATFSAAKMKKLVPLMNNVVKVFCDEVDKRVGQELEIYDLYQRLTIQVIGETILALRIDSLGDPNEPMFRSVQYFMKQTGSKLGLFLIYFPFLSPLFRFTVKHLKVKVIEDLMNNLLKVIKLRRTTMSKEKTIDIVQLMIEAGDNPVAEETDGTERSKLGSPHLAPLTDLEIASNCWLFMLAGFETTATSLAFIAHSLANYQDIQNKVYEEIIEKIQGDHHPSYEEVNHLPYMDQMINETLRVYPPVVLFMTRVAAEEYDLNGIKIPKGTHIEIPIYNVHHDPEVWPDPERFDPERFSAENKGNIHPMAHLAFGTGPRNCLGSRFALLEIKCALVRLLRNYKLVPSAKTLHPPRVYIPHSTYIPKTGIYVKIERR